MTLYRLWPATNGPALSAGDVQAYTMDMQFSLSVDATLTAIYWWRATLASPAPTLCGIYDINSALLLAPAEPFANPGITTGWIRQALASPLALTAATKYRVAVFGALLGYSATPHYWDTDPVVSGIITAPAAPASSGGGQDTFHAGPLMTYPSDTFNNANYWIDLEVDDGVTPPPASAPAALWLTGEQRPTYGRLAL